MLPDSPAAKQNYIEMRDARNRHRQMYLRVVHGDVDAFNKYVLRCMAVDCEMSDLREAADFAAEENILTEEMQKAVESCIAWGQHLHRLLTDQVGIAE